MSPWPDRQKFHIHICESIRPDSDHVATIMHERALVHSLFAETYSYYQLAPALQNYAASPLLYISDKRIYRCTGT